MAKLSRIRYVAAAVHAGLFLVGCALFVSEPQPLVNGIAGTLLFGLFLADRPISSYAVAAMFTGRNLFVWTITWGVIGTLWWFFLGCVIELAVRVSVFGFQSASRCFRRKPTATH